MKIFLILAFLFINSAQAIEWTELKSAKNQTIMLDKDSITTKKNYYFFNLKMFTNGLDDIVVTMQCATTHPFCARIKHYKNSQYESLNGNYQNITQDSTTKLEPITYTSKAYAAYKAVSQIEKSKIKPEITF